jgi:hypothetical protein
MTNNSWHLANQLLFIGNIQILRIPFTYLEGVDEVEILEIDHA